MAILVDEGERGEKENRDREKAEARGGRGEQAPKEGRLAEVKIGAHRGRGGEDVSVVLRRLIHVIVGGGARRKSR